MEEAFYVSRKKYEALVNELKDLKTLKAELSNEIGEAAAQGDLKENAAMKRPVLNLPILGWALWSLTRKRAFCPLSRPWLMECWAKKKGKPLKPFCHAVRKNTNW